MVNSSIQLGEHNWEMDQRMIYRGNLPEGTKDTLEIMLTFNGDSVPITLKRAENERSFEQAGYYDMTGDQGGLLVIPRLENGELIVSIYPLNEGDLTIDAGLTKLCGELANVFVSADGKMVPSIEVMIDGVNTSITPLYLEPQFREVTDPETGWTYEAMDDLLMGCYEGIDEVYGCIFTDKLCYRWDHEFVISFEVSETE